VADAKLVGLPPGAATRAPELVARLAAALRAKGKGYLPRTRHRDAEGRPLYTNRLILEASPYLLQHAHNPVDWYPWGDEAFDRARRESKPVFLSIGYATCHWCHVMEEESFEDEEIARFLNQHYVAIKVDREERPDVDGVYMAAVEALTGGGGWPLNVWLTPQREPFFGGTYFPPRDGMRGMRRGLASILTQLDEAFREDPVAVASQAERIVAQVRESLEAPPGVGGLSAAQLQQGADQLLATYDPVWGGFGGAPKFPRSVTLEFLLRYWRRSGSRAALEAVTTTLDRMGRGGVHDQLGGGFHRYSTDERWVVPHFEKMLSDNALLATAYVEAWQATGDPGFAQTARETLDYLLTEMRSPEGGFFSATDADSEGEEGRFFVWLPQEIDAALPSEQAQVVKAYFGVTEAGNFEGRSVLWVPRPASEVAAELGMSEDRLASELTAARTTLRAVRARRVPPLRDDKIVAGWNGLTISALARAGFAFGEPRYTRAAAETAGFVCARMVDRDGRLLRSFAAGAARHPAVLEDYAFVIAGLLDLHEATQEIVWAQRAIALQALLAAHFADPRGAFYATPDDGPQLFAREKPDSDGATPSGNSVAIQDLLRLAELTGDERYRGDAERALRSFSGLLTRNPTAAPRLLSALDFYLDVPKEIVVVVPGSARDPLAAAEPLLDRLRRSFVPNRTLLVGAEGGGLDAVAALSPVAAGRRSEGEAPTAYVCEGRVCELPTGDPAAFARQLEKVAKLAPAG